MERAPVKAGTADVKFTVHKDAGHDCWTATYKDTEILNLILFKRRTVKGDEKAVADRNKVDPS